MMPFLSASRRPFGVASCLLLLSALSATTVFAQDEDVSRQGHRTFADALTTELYSNDNECTSAWGVSMMLDLVNPGGTADTKDEFCNVVSLCSSDDQQQLLWSATVNRLVQEYDGRCVNDFVDVSGVRQCTAFAPTLEIANSIWVDESRSLDPDYTAIVGDFVQQTNFEAPTAGAEVNAWVNASTKRLINSIVEEGPLFPPYVLMALNSIYLKAEWQKTFAQLHTNQDLFYDSPTRTTPLAKEAHFMHMVNYFPYSHDAIPGYQVLQLPYSSSTLSMVLALPMDAAASLQSPPSSTNVINAISSLSPQRMALALPKFKFESKYSDDLETALKNMGVVSAFDEQQGGFCDLFDDTAVCQYINLIVQKTLIEVNEFGTVAAAVTLGGLSPTSVPIDTPITFMADHAFQFYIYDQTEDLVLFEGRVGAPEIFTEPTTELLQAKHKDDNFWKDNFGVDPTIAMNNSTVLSSTPSPTPGDSTTTSPPPSMTSTSPPTVTTTTMPPDPTSPPPSTGPPTVTSTMPPEPTSPGTVAAWSKGGLVILFVVALGLCFSF